MTAGDGGSAADPDQPNPKLEWVRPPVVMKEWRSLGLKDHESIKLSMVMTRHAKGETQKNDVKKLAKDLWEIRVNIDKRVVRLYFTQTDDKPPVLLALHVKVKKVSNDREGKALATERLKAFRRGTFG